MPHTSHGTQSQSCWGFWTALTHSSNKIIGLLESIRDDKSYDPFVNPTQTPVGQDRRPQAVSEHRVPSHPRALLVCAECQPEAGPHQSHTHSLACLLVLGTLRVYPGVQHCGGSAEAVPTASLPECGPAVSHRGRLACLLSAFPLVALFQRYSKW